jgi:hypothetical protein
MCLDVVWSNEKLQNELDKLKWNDSGETIVYKVMGKKSNGFWISEFANEKKGDELPLREDEWSPIAKTIKGYRSTFSGKYTVGYHCWINLPNIKDSFAVACGYCKVVKCVIRRKDICAGGERRAAIDGIPVLVSKYIKILGEVECTV